MVKNGIIKRASTPKKVLLLTKAFGRGTDFQVHDKIVRNNDGPLIICQFGLKGVYLLVFVKTKILMIQVD